MWKEAATSQMIFYFTFEMELEKVLTEVTDDAWRILSDNNVYVSQQIGCN